MIRPQYHFRQVGTQVHIWDVRRLIALSENLPVVQLAISDITELDKPYWHALPPSLPEIRNIAAHMVQTQEADLSYPILLCADGCVMDGMHRIVRAMTLGQSQINVRKLTETPPPNYVDVAASDLPYD
ncbi:hypothetical protein [Thalassobium sp. R2A62]|uniref:hypothetical protein n=1 Tax=Thalassobium sp. R2A62 TaxID=633131 RepID=UPI0001B1D50D|nr:hypothetical protein [Thalassobium sp. R2A62]EET48536.1 hypothetical protein TR2A62_2935 [Thalassobium sp. R2A62]